MNSQIGTFHGIKIFENINLTKMFADWSQVRSPSRARRRLKRGFKQNIRYVEVPDPNVYMFGDVAHMHPDTARQMRKRISEVNN